MKISDFQNISERDKNKVSSFIKSHYLVNNLDVFKLLHANLPPMIKMQICSFFNPLLMWREQLTPLIGQEEVDRLDGKLRDINIKGMACCTP